MCINPADTGVRLPFNLEAPQTWTSKGHHAHFFHGVMSFKCLGSNRPAHTKQDIGGMCEKPFVKITCYRWKWTHNFWNSWMQAVSETPLWTAEVSNGKQDYWSDIKEKIPSVQCVRGQISVQKDDQ
jgi:hypothetical protein